MTTGYLPAFSSRRTIMALAIASKYRDLTIRKSRKISYDSANLTFSYFNHHHHNHLPRLFPGILRLASNLISGCRWIAGILHGVDCLFDETTQLVLGNRIPPCKILIFIYISNTLPSTKWISMVELVVRLPGHWLLDNSVVIDIWQFKDLHLTTRTNSLMCFSSHGEVLHSIFVFFLKELCYLKLTNMLTFCFLMFLFQFERILFRWHIKT